MVELALDWAFVWPLYLAVIGYGQVATLWLATMLVLTTWRSLPRSVGLAGMTLACAGVFLLELSFVGTGGVRVGLAVLAGFLVFLGIGVAVTSAGGHLRRKEFRVLPWWSVPLGLVLVAVSIWASTAWLLHEAGQNPALRIDAIKTGLTVGAGAGGVTALLLAVRRQWLNERAQVHTESDAVERRVTELFSTAAEHLGHEKAAVRLAGLKTLERLGQAHVEHRQTVVDLICAYLRMPFVHPDETTGSEEAGVARQERQVRLEAQGILSRHLAWAAASNEEQWECLGIDLTGAALENFELPGCDLRMAEFGSAEFRGDSVFVKSAFAYARFAGAVFEGQVSFVGAQFRDRADFAHARFRGPVSFYKAVMEGEDDFSEAMMRSKGCVCPTGWRVEAEPGARGEPGRLVRKVEAVPG
ncbi:pentapeptide repeat-containing protein [Flindersiella endophytica]